jgi:hypothetical protein
MEHLRGVLGEPLGGIRAGLEGLDQQAQVLGPRGVYGLEVPVGLEDDRVGSVSLADGLDVGREVPALEAHAVSRAW